MGFRIIGPLFKHRVSIVFWYLRVLSLRILAAVMSIGLKLFSTPFLVSHNSEQCDPHFAVVNRTESSIDYQTV